MIKVLELYSGIGGMHFALERSGIQYEVVAAVDINPTCNAVYSANFPSTCQIAKCLTSLTLDEFNGFGMDMVVMSPPCQPFTVIGNQKDVDDERTNSFQYFLSLLPKLKKLPFYILLENVKGMESSKMRIQLLETLKSLNYVIQEFILCPTQFSIPNSRRRYYMLAKLHPLTFCFSSKEQMVSNLNEINTDVNLENLFPHIGSLNNDMTMCMCSQCRNNASCSENGHTNMIPLANFLEREPLNYFDNYRLPIKLYKKFWLMDLVNENSSSCCCFTKGYGRYVEKSGSIFQMYPSFTDLWHYKNKEDCKEFIEEVNKLGLRFFSPREIANIMCFPKKFCFLKNMTNQQCYRVLGNSINVHVVSFLVILLTS